MYKHFSWTWQDVARTVVIVASAAIVIAVLPKMHGIKEATRYAEIVRPQIQADPRFALVQCGGGGSLHEGCLWVVGTVSSKQDLAALQGLVDSTHPPVPPLYQVRVEASASVHQP